MIKKLSKSVLKVYFRAIGKRRRDSRLMLVGHRHKQRQLTWLHNHRY